MGIKFKEVSHQYKSLMSNKHAIFNINLNINPFDEIVAVVGETGSGKSTLIKHMNALLLPTKGKVTIFGQDLPAKKRTKIAYLRQKVGLVFQFPEYQLFESTVLKDIMFGPLNFKTTKDNAEKLALDAAKKLNIDEAILSKSPLLLSGGQMRRVAIAGIIAMNPDILILDEPSRGLDPKGRTDVMNAFLDDFKQNRKTIILISHDMELVLNYAKRVIVMQKGGIAFDGSTKDLFESPDFPKYGLAHPPILKIMNELEKKLKIPYKFVKNKDDLLNYLKDYYV